MYYEYRNTKLQHTCDTVCANIKRKLKYTFTQYINFGYLIEKAHWNDYAMCRKHHKNSSEISNTISNKKLLQNQLQLLILSTDDKNM